MWSWADTADNASRRKLSVNVTKISVSAVDFARLPLPERLLFVRVAHSYNDLRHIQQLVVRAVGATKKHDGIEQEIATHQMLYGIRQWYAALNESWTIFRSSWGNEGVGKKFYPMLTKGKRPYQHLNQYFSHSNLVRTVRDRFAYHYDNEYLPRLLVELNPESELHFVTTQ